MPNRFYNLALALPLKPTTPSDGITLYLTPASGPAVPLRRMEDPCGPFFVPLGRTGLDRLDSLALIEDPDGQHAGLVLIE